MATRRSNLTFLAVYLLLLAAAGGGMAWARQRTLAVLTTPDAQAKWDAWRVRAAEDRADKNAPVERRAPRSDEPPTLVMMRDYFWPGLFGVWLGVTFVFVMVAITIRSMMDDRAGDSTATSPH